MIHPDFTQLLNMVMPFAKECLSERGEFFPFGASITTDGKVQMNNASTKKSRPEAEEVVDVLIRNFAQLAGTLRATAICSHVQVPLPGESIATPAISVALEHPSRDAVTVFLPYRKAPWGPMVYGKQFVTTEEIMFLPRR